MAMGQALAASEITLYDLEESFGLQIVEEDFVGPWLVEAAPISGVEQQMIDRIRHNYQHLVRYGGLSEESVKMVVLSYLLDLAGFYQSPFQILTEPSVKVAAKDGGLLVRGDIDVLVIAHRLWVLVVESKATRFDVMSALPQALSYMLANPDKEACIYGFLVNGREFLFVKLDRRSTTPNYSLSQAFSINKPDTDLPDVLQLLKALGKVICPGPSIPPNPPPRNISC
jgi:hypothetical protein